MNNGAFGTQVGDASGNVAFWSGMPATYHNGACGYSFADGHWEIHKWIGPLVNRSPVKFIQYWYGGKSTLPADVADWRWHRKRTMPKLW